MYVDSKNMYLNLFMCKERNVIMDSLMICFLFFTKGYFEKVRHGTEKALGKEKQINVIVIKIEIRYYSYYIHNGRILILNMRKRCQNRINLINIQ